MSDLIALFNPFLPSSRYLLLSQHSFIIFWPEEKNFQILQKLRISWPYFAHGYFFIHSTPFFYQISHIFHKNKTTELSYRVKLPLILTIISSTLLLYKKLKLQYPTVNARLHAEIDEKITIFIEMKKFLKSKIFKVKNIFKVD